jgi:hypothetical protein
MKHHFSTMSINGIRKDLRSTKLVMKVIVKKKEKKKNGTK